MDIYVSYFYNVRFLPTNAIPLSTAKWDPAWFHENQASSHVFVDKRGVTLGLRCRHLVLDESRWNKLLADGCECQPNCPQPKDGTCRFMQEYLDQLHYYYPNGPLELLESLEKTADIWRQYGEEPFIVLLVHEAPSVSCSERIVLQNWFKEYGMILPEWKKGL